MADLRSDCVRYIRLRRNAGKSAALSIGLDHVRGELVVLMDADGQDDPNELAKMLARLDEGVDLVTGRRAIRHDRFVKRTTSKLYNGATSKVTGVPGKDFNSGFKVMRRDVADSLEMYGELHRYIPVLAVWNGFKVAEVDVEHHERLHGRSKFGRARFWRGFLDLVTVKFLTTYTARPFHLFGGLGFVIGAVGLGLLVWMTVSKLLGNAIGDRPALQLGVLLVVVAVQMVSLGLLAELMVNLRRRRRLDATADGDLVDP
jgi:glycosyltransferase involved in cell wall biosynthesis